MTASIVLTGIGAGYPNPGVYVEVNYAQGNALPGTGTYSILILANKTSAGSGTADTVIYGPDTPVPLQSEQDMINIGGPGSEAHRCFRAMASVLGAGSTIPVYWLFVGESAGTAASKNITLTGAASGAGNLRVYVGGGFTPGEEYVDVVISSGDTADAIKSAAITAINTRTFWPVTASSGGVGIITLTAKQKGPRGNDIMVQCAITNGITTSVDTTTRTPLASGATADSNATALTTISGQRYFYIGSAANDATQFGAIGSALGTQALPGNGIRQHALAGFSGTLANANTLSTTLNNARCGVAWQDLSDFTPAEIMAHTLAVIALEEAGKLPRPRHNFSLFGQSADTQSKWKLRAPRSAVTPTPTEIQSALNNGTSPIASNRNGSSFLVKLVTTRSLNGSNADYRVRDWHRATGPDFFADDLSAQVIARYQGKDIEDDPPADQPPLPQNNNAVNSRGFKDTVFEMIDFHNDNGNAKNVSSIKAGTQVQRETTPTNRMSARVPWQSVDIFDQACIAIDQVG